MRAVVNPTPSAGGDDPEDEERGRRNAAMRTRALDRVVSLSDYEDFALAFPGVGKARAAWLWDTRRRIVHLTVAGTDGERMPATGVPATSWPGWKSVKSSTSACRRRP